MQNATEIESEVKDWKTADGLKVHCRMWGDPNADRQIWLVHGLGDHGGRYKELSAKLVRHGYRVVIADHRGSGLSEGRRGHVDSFKQLLDDLQLAIENTDCGARHRFLLGQSMGGLMVARYLMRRAQDFTGAVLLSPMFRTTSPTPGWKLILAKLMRKLFPGFRLRTRFRGEELTGSREKRQAYRKDELKHDFVSASLGMALLEEGEAAIREADTIRTPTLVMHGDIDSITCSEAATEFCQNGSATEMKIWSGRRHELHNEEGHEEIVNFFVDWMESKISQVTQPENA